MITGGASAGTTVDAVAVEIVEWTRGCFEFRERTFVDPEAWSIPSNSTSR